MCGRSGVCAASRGTERSARAERMKRKDEAGEVAEGWAWQEDVLPEFLLGPDWSMRERRHSYAFYLGLPARISSR